jgi:two-component system LytT family response regulator
MNKNENPIRVLIVDDEKLGREIIIDMLGDKVESGLVQITGECINGREAVAAIQTLRPDLIFLDVQMPELDGFGVLSALPNSEIPRVIFVTAFDQYAVRAFEFYALDYLLKPFDEERFEAAFERAKAEIRRNHENSLNERILALLENRASELPVQTASYLERFVVKAEGRIYFVDVDEIEWISAEGNYVALHTGKKSHLLRETIASLEEQLDPRKFQRVHRSTIVRLNFIKELQPMFRGDYTVVLRDGTKLKMSQGFRDKFMNSVGGSI